MMVKKLDLDGNKKQVLKQALLAQAEDLDQDMRRIYDRTAEMLDSCLDRILLTPGQEEVCRYALRGNNAPEALDMMAQLTMSRKDYAAQKATA